LEILVDKFGPVYRFAVTRPVRRTEDDGPADFRHPPKLYDIGVCIEAGRKDAARWRGVPPFDKESIWADGTGKYRSKGSVDGEEDPEVGGKRHHICTVLVGSEAFQNIKEPTEKCQLIGPPVIVIEPIAECKLTSPVDKGSHRQHSVVRGAEIVRIGRHGIIFPYEVVNVGRREDIRPVFLRCSGIPP